MKTKKQNSLTLAVAILEQTTQKNLNQIEFETEEDRINIYSVKDGEKLKTFLNTELCTLFSFLNLSCYIFTDERGFNALTVF